MSPGRTALKAVTPGSVKVLMLVEAGIIGFLSYWVASEYSYNSFLRTYVDQILLSHVTTYSAVLGLGIGLAGTASAAILYRNLQHAKRRLEHLVVPKIRGAVDKLVPVIPGAATSPQLAIAVEQPSSPQVQATSTSETAIVPVPVAAEEKKESS